MSNEQSSPSPPLSDGRTQSKPSPLQNARALLIAAALVGAGVAALAWDASPELQAVALALAVAAVFLRSLLIVCLFLGWIWAGNLVVGPWVAQDHLGVGNILSTVGLLGFVIGALRYMELYRPPLHYAAAQGETEQDAARSPSANFLIRPTLGFVWRLVMAVALALLVLRFLPLERMSPNPPQLIPQAFRAVALLWGLGLVAFLLAPALTWLRWRRLSPAQANLYLRRMLDDDLRREHAAIARAQKRRRNET